MRSFFISILLGCWVGTGILSGCQSQLDELSSAQRRDEHRDASTVLEPDADIGDQWAGDAGNVLSPGTGTPDPTASCSPGSYVASAATNDRPAQCSGCLSGTYSDTDDAEECRTWTSCKPGEYVSSPGSSTADQLCEACPEGRTSTGMNAGSCVPTDACPGGTIETTQAEAGNPAECEPCEVGTYCAGGVAPAVDCQENTWDHDADPGTSCVSHTNCTAGQYLTRAGDATRDNSCSECAAGKFTLQTNADTCIAQTDCAPGGYISQTGGATSDQVCASCPAGTYSDEANQDECTPWTVCQPGEYIGTTGTTTSDQICVSCDEGEFSETENAVRCVSGDECPPGTEQTAPAASGSPPECEACSPGAYCFGGERAAEACAKDTWDHDADPATPCVDRTDCLAGSYVQGEGSATSDRTCSACGAGTFSDATNANSCVPWTVCGPGKFVQTTASTTNDRVCSNCSSGTFSTTTNASGCNPWATCSAPSFYQTAEPSSTSNRQCAACPSPAATSSDNATTCEAPAFRMSDAQAVMEAENYDSKSSNGTADSWTLVSVSGVSGDAAMQLGPNDDSQYSDTAAAPRMVYHVNFTTTGVFYIHVRGDAGDTRQWNTNSCFAGFDDAGVYYSFEEDGGVWGWVSHSATVETTGFHTVTIWGREDGFLVDKIVVNQVANAPSGNGPAESPHD